MWKPFLEPGLPKNRWPIGFGSRAVVYWPLMYTPVPNPRLSSLILQHNGPVQALAVLYSSCEAGSHVPLTGA